MGIPEELFVDPSIIPLRLYCTICLDVVEDACITQCGHLYCLKCINELKQTTSECPNCREKITSINVANVARDIVLNLQVYCSPNKELRCGWTGKYSMYHNHKERMCPLSSAEEKYEAKLYPLKLSEYQDLSFDELLLLSVKRLKEILKNIGKNSSDYIEKSDMAHTIYNHFHKNSSNPIYPKTKEYLLNVPIKELINYLKSKNIQFNQCLEKTDIVNLILEVQEKENVNRIDYHPIYEKHMNKPLILDPSQNINQQQTTNSQSFTPNQTNSAEQFRRTPSQRRSRSQSQQQRNRQFQPQHQQENQEQSTNSFQRTFNNIFNNFSNIFNRNHSRNRNG